MADPHPEAALWTPSVRAETRPGGATLVWQEDPLGPCRRAITERFMDRAARVPDRVWMAERGADRRRRETS